MIRVINTNVELQVRVDIPGGSTVIFRAFDKNEWEALCPHLLNYDDNLPEDVLAVLRQIYLHCRNMGQLNWIAVTKYDLIWTDPMFDPIWKYLDVDLYDEEETDDD